MFSIALVALVAMGTGTIIQIQSNATNSTSNSSTLYGKPDQTKFCAEFNNDDGTTGESCEFKSKGECKKGSIAAGDDFRECTKND